MNDKTDDYDVTEPMSKEEAKLFARKNELYSVIFENEQIFTKTRYKQEKYIDGRLSEDEYAVFKNQRTIAAQNISDAQEEINTINLDLNKYKKQEE